MQSSPYRPTNLTKRLIVVGEGAATRAVVQALAAYRAPNGRANGPCFAEVKAQADFPTQWHGVGALIDLTHGVTASFTGVMEALRHGVPVFTANSLLMAAHGATLSAAASGQCTLLGTSAAGMGWPWAAPLQAPETLVASWDGAARRMLARMRERAEDAVQARTALLLRGLDVSDEHGKHTLGRALTLHAATFGHWLPVRQVVRRTLEPSALPWELLTQAGLTLTFGARLTANSVQVGPLAVPLGHALAQPQPGQTLVLAESGRMQQISQWQAPADSLQGLVGSLLHDVHQWQLGLAIRPAYLSVSSNALPMREAPQTWVNWQEGTLTHGEATPGTPAWPQGAVPVVGGWQAPARQTTAPGPFWRQVG